MSDLAQAEQLWARAHENVKRADFAQAVRELAQCYQLLQAHNDPRLYDVHRRWTEVHQMYLEDGKRESPPRASTQEATPEAEAEAAANAGDLPRAIALLERVVAERPDHALARERLAELRAALTRANDLQHGTSAAQATTAPQTTRETMDVAVDAVEAAEDDWSDLNERAPATVQTSGAEPSGVAPVMKADDAPVGQPSIDVEVSIGPAISRRDSDKLPVAAFADPEPAAEADASNNIQTIARLRELLDRVQANRREA